MSWKYKISQSDITVGPQAKTEIDELTSVVWAKELMDQGYRKVSNAYCRVARIDREDWLDVLAKHLRCSRADFYNVDGSGIGDRWRDHYVRVYSKDKQTVHPLILRKISAYF